MLKFMDSLVKRYLKAKDGTIAVAMGVGIVFIVLMVAFGVDTARLTQASSKLKALSDAAALAATEGQNRTLEERKAIFEHVMATGIASSPELSGYQFELNYETREDASVLMVSTHSEAQLFFPMTRGNGRNVGAYSEITVGREHVEVAMVLDISSSMGGAKIAELKNSAKNFIETLMDNETIQGRVSIAVVPYGGSVKLPNDLNYLLNPPATTQHWVGGQWNGCLSTTPLDYVTGLTPARRLDYMPDFSAYQQANNWCPRAGNEMVGLTKNRNNLLNKIDGLTLSDGTATDIGVAWGLAVLDSRWRGQIQGVTGGSPRNHNARTKKIMVVMTDGRITGQRFPTGSELTGPPPFRAANYNYTGDVANTGFQTICDFSKTKDVEIYTIGFELDTAQIIDRLHYCGTSPAHNFEADLGQLTTVFENIATSISGLRVSG